MRNISVVQKGSLPGSGKMRALVMTNKEWTNLVSKQLSNSQKQADAVERKRNEEDSRKQMSKEMSNTWDNTLINLRRRRLELRRERLAKLEEDRRQRYLQTRQEEKDESKRMREEAKDRIRKKQDNYRILISSVRFSEVLKEREEQIKFNEKLKEIEAQKAFDYAESIRKDVKEFKCEEIKKQLDYEEKKKRLFESFQQQFKDFFDKRKTYFERKIEQEKEDNINIKREIIQEEENARKEAIKKRQLVMDDVIENRRMIEEQKEIRRLEEEEEDNAVEIHAATKKRIAHMRKQKELEMHEKTQERRHKISTQLHSQATELEAKENEILMRAIAERDAREEEKLAKKKQYKERLLKEVKEARQNYLKQKEESFMKEEEESKWNLIQRYKQAEENKIYLKQTHIDRIRRMQLNKATWDVQCAENTAAAVERCHDIKAVERAAEWWRDEDKQFLEYAQELLKESQENGRPVLPILRCIEEYKRVNNLCKPRPQHKTWKSKVPIDSCSTLEITKAQTEMKI